MSEQKSYFEIKIKYLKNEEGKLRIIGKKFYQKYKHKCGIIYKGNHYK